MDGQTDGQTDIFAISISRVSVLTRDKNHDLRPISGFISELMQASAIVTMEGEWETAPKLSNGTILNDLERPLTRISRS